MASTPLQASVENFLEVKEVCFGYVKVTSDYNLSNALTLVAIGHIQASSTFLVQKGISTVEKKASFKWHVFDFEDVKKESIS